MTTADVNQIVEALANAKNRLMEAERKRDDIGPADYRNEGVGGEDIQRIQDEIEKLEKALESAGGYTYTL